MAYTFYAPLTLLEAPDVPSNEVLDFTWFLHPFASSQPVTVPDAYPNTNNDWKLIQYGILKARCFSEEERVAWKERLLFGIRRPANASTWGDDRYNLTTQYFGENYCVMTDLDTMAVVVETSELLLPGNAIYQAIRNEITGKWRFYNAAYDKYLAVVTNSMDTIRNICAVSDGFPGYTTEFFASTSLPGTTGPVLYGADPNASPNVENIPPYQYTIRQAFTPQKFLSCTNVATAALTQVTTSANTCFVGFYPHPYPTQPFSYSIRTYQKIDNEYQYLSMNEADDPVDPSKKVYTIQLRAQPDVDAWEEWVLFPLVGTNQLGSFKLVCANVFDSGRQEILPKASPSVAVVGDSESIGSNNTIATFYFAPTIPQAVPPPAETQQAAVTSTEAADLTADFFGESSDDEDEPSHRCCPNPIHWCACIFSFVSINSSHEGRKKCSAPPPSPPSLKATHWRGQAAELHGWAEHYE